MGVIGYSTEGSTATVPADGKSWIYWAGNATMTEDSVIDGAYFYGYTGASEAYDITVGVYEVDSTWTDSVLVATSDVNSFGNSTANGKHELEGISGTLENGKTYACVFVVDITQGSYPRIKTNSHSTWGNTRGKTINTTTLPDTLSGYSYTNNLAWSVWVEYSAAPPESTNVVLNIIGS